MLVGLDGQGTIRAYVKARKNDDPSLDPLPVLAPARPLGKLPEMP